MQWSSVALLITSLITTRLALKIWTFFDHSRKAKANNCGEPNPYPHTDTIWGGDWSQSMGKALADHRILTWFEEQWARMGTKTFKRSAWLMQRNIIYTMDVENFKAVSSDQAEEFLMEPINGHLQPFIGRTLNTADGEAWRASRALVSPYFQRQAFANVDRLAPFTERLLDLIPANGVEFNIQPLLSRWFLDAMTSFLVGESRNSLICPENDDVTRTIVYIMQGVRKRQAMGRLSFLFRDAEWTESINKIHSYIDQYIDQAFEEKQLSETLPSSGKSSDEPERTDLLWSLVQQVNDRVVIRDQIASVWLGGGESTSIVVANCLFLLARDKRAWNVLQEKVATLSDEKLTYSNLKKLTYLTWVINEAQRILASGASLVCQTSRDTTIPRGGGSLGTLPVFCAKGDWVVCNRYMAHRDPDFWGPGAAEFRPERWEGLQPGWHFCPFGKGPRTCPANLMVMTEAAYVLVSFVRRFGGLESRDARPFAPVLSTGASNFNGVHIAVVRR